MNVMRNQNKTYTVMKRNEAWSTSVEELNKLLTEDTPEDMSEFEYQLNVAGYYNFLHGLLMGSFDVDDEQLSEDFLYFLVTSNLNPFELGLDECKTLYLEV